MGLHLGNTLYMVYCTGCIYKREYSYMWSLLVSMKCYTMRLLFLFQLLTLLTLTAGRCNVYGYLQEESVNRCHQVQDCINKAFYSDKNNQYIIEKVFETTEQRPPVELIIKYNVTRSVLGGQVDMDEEQDNSTGSGSASREIYLDAHIHNSSKDEQVTELYEIGWSTTGIYKAIRPVILLSLQPAWYRWTLSFAINEYGFTRAVQFKLNLTDTNICHEIENMTRSEVKEALDHLSMKVKPKATSYVWNTDTTSLQYSEKMLFIIIVSMGIAITLLLTVTLPKMYAYSSKFDWVSGGLGVLLFVIAGTEFLLHLHYLLMKDESRLYIAIRVLLGWINLSLLIGGSLYGATASCFIYKCKRIFATMDFFGTAYVIGVCFSAYLLPMLIQAFVYPTEVISTIGFAVMGITCIPLAHTVLKRSIAKEHKQSAKSKCCYYFKTPVMAISVYAIIPFTVYVLLVLYLSLLRLLSESPTTQFTQTLLAFLPSIVTLVISFLVNKKLGTKTKGQDKSESAKEVDDPSGDNERDSNKKPKTKDGYRRLASEQTDHSASCDSDSDINTHGDIQAENGQPRRRGVRADNRQFENGTQSPEMEVVAEVHQNSTLDESDSIV